MTQGVPALGAVHPAALALAGIISIQLGAAAATTVFDSIGVTGLLTIRLAAAAVVLLAVGTPWRRRARPVGYVYAAALGLVLGATGILFYSAAERLPIGAVVTIEYLGPVTLAVVAARRRSHVLWAVLAITGVVLLVAPWSGAEQLDPSGVAFALGSAACWAAYIGLTQRVGHFFEKSAGVAVAMVFAVAVPIGPGIAEAGSRLLEPKMLMIGCLLGIACSVIPFSLEMEVLRRMSARVFGVLMSLQPTVAAIVGWLMLGQSLSARSVVAIVIVVVAGAAATTEGDHPLME